MILEKFYFHEKKYILAYHEIFSVKGFLGSLDEKRYIRSEINTDFKIIGK